MRRILLLTWLAAMCTVVGCLGSRIAGRAPVVPPAGILFGATAAPLTTKLQGTPALSTQGEASTYFLQDPILTGLSFAWGDASIDRAAANGHLSAVDYADYDYFHILGIFGKFTVTAYGN